MRGIQMEIAQKLADARRIYHRLDRMRTLPEAPLDVYKRQAEKRPLPRTSKGRKTTNHFRHGGDFVRCHRHVWAKPSRPTFF